MSFVQSGSALADWALIIDKYRAQNTSRVYAQHLGCNIESSYKLVDCLRRGRNFYELGNTEFEVNRIYHIKDKEFKKTHGL